MKKLDSLISVFLVVVAAAVIFTSLPLAAHADSTGGSSSAASSGSSEADAIITFKDSYLKSELIDQGLDTNGDGSISVSEMAKPTGLLIDNANVTDLTGLEYATNLKNLVVENTKLATIQTNVLSKLSKLDKLQLSNDKISSIPANAFSGLTSLEYLYLDGNSITSLPANAFKGLSSLTYLLLSKNDITSIESGAFNGLSNLQQLIIEKNDITTLKSDVFSGLTSLKQLSLYDNGITSMPSGIFSGLSNLSYVRLDSNKISSIASGVFSGYYEYLYLDHNKLTDISSLSGITSNSNVDVSYNYLDISSSNAAPRSVINALSAKGVTVAYEPQYTTVTAVKSSGSSVSDGSYTSGSVTVTVLNGTKTLTATKSGTGISIANGVNTFTSSGKYVINAVGGADTAKITFTIDKTKPSIKATDSSRKTVSNGKITSKSVTVKYSDTNYKSKSVTRNGSPYSWPSKSVFSSSGSYVVTVKDKAGNSSTFSFKIDKTSPAVTATRSSGSVIKSKGYSRTNVTVSATDSNLSSVSVTKNKKAVSWPANGVFMASGTYVVTAKDSVGHKTSFTFTIDKSAPKITVKSLKGKTVANGGSVKRGARIRYSDSHYSSKYITKNGRKIRWSSKVTKKGKYVVTVKDKAGNKKTFTFRVK